MDPSRSTATVLEGPEALFKSFVQGERGGKLRSQLAKLHPHASIEEIEDAIQAACDRFVDKAEGITEPGQVYAWLRTTVHRILNREDDHHERELAVDPTTETGLQQLAGEQPGPEEETIEREDEAELVALVREVSESLPEQKREVLALYSSGLKRPEILQPPRHERPKEPEVVRQFCQAIRCSCRERVKRHVSDAPRGD